jgi:hypothetical protein
VKIDLDTHSEGEEIMGETSETLKNWSQLVAQVWADEKLKRRLIDNPAAVLQEHGIDVPAGVEIRVVENTDKVSYLMLPPKPAGGVSELTPGQLSSVAGGFCSFGCLACRDPDCIIIGPVTVTPVPKPILT